MNNEDHVRELIRKENITIVIVAGIFAIILIVLLIWIAESSRETHLVNQRTTECLIYSRLDTKCGPGEVKYVSKTNRCSCFSPRGKEISFPYAMPEKR